MDWFDKMLRGIPTHEDFCSGKIRVLGYILFENGYQTYFWSTKESDAEISEEGLIELETAYELKIDRLAIFKLHKVFDRTEGKTENVV